MIKFFKKYGRTIGQSIIPSYPQRPRWFTPPPGHSHAPPGAICLPVIRGGRSRQRKWACPRLRGRYCCKHPVECIRAACGSCHRAVASLPRCFPTPAPPGVGSIARQPGRPGCEEQKRDEGLLLPQKGCRFCCDQTFGMIT